jgi:hypothetical protein
MVGTEFGQRANSSDVVFILSIKGMSTMKHSLLVAAMVAVALSACAKKQEPAPAPAPAAAPAPAPAPAAAPAQPAATEGMAGEKKAEEKPMEGQAGMAKPEEKAPEAPKAAEGAK